MSFLKKKINAIHYVISLLIMISILTGCGFIKNYKNYKKDIVNLSITNIDINKVKNGVYSGEYDLHTIVRAKVLVSVKDHKIVEIKLLEHKNIKGKKANIIPDKVIQVQSLNVDTVSGATNSSKIILKAIENALKKGME